MRVDKLGSSRQNGNRQSQMSTSSRAGRDAWTPWETQQLLDGVELGETTDQLTLRVPGRSASATRKKVMMLRRVNHWTIEELQALHDGVAAQKTIAQITADIPTRTTKAIWAQLKAADLKPAPTPLGPRPMPNGVRRSNKFSWVKQDNRESWTERRCMTCNAKFHSWGIGNRLCLVHRREGE